ncbi:MAG: hypothetical protein NXI16_16600 [Alphaproteobacteria bacterium]|nr:hypothetical protein [Alphaproteobacteria bacterium]
MIVIVAVGSIGVGGKALTVVSGNAATEMTGAMHIEALAAAAEDHGLVQRSRVALTEEGAYWAVIFSEPGCDGRLTVIPMLRNGEIVGLSSLLKGEVRYAIGGHDYERLTLFATLHNKLVRMLPSSATSLAPAVYAERGECNLRRMFF